MIRREIQLAGQPPQWLLISQIEHARISGLLAKQCLSHLEEPIREELTQAIIHHDDGWANWERRPTLDADGRPPSFRELPFETSLPIWTASIDAAATIGPFAAWVVAGHFLALLQFSDKPAQPFVDQWQQQTTARQNEWLAAWQAIDPQRHVKSLADEALRWLQLMDVMSLWLCSACPCVGEDATEPPNDYQVSQGNSWETTFSYKNGVVRIRPWRFNCAELEVEATGWIIPAQSYDLPEALLAVREPVELRWLLGRPEQ